GAGEPRGIVARRPRAVLLPHLSQALSRLLDLEIRLIEERARARQIALANRAARQRGVQLNTLESLESALALLGLALVDLLLLDAELVSPTHGLDLRRLGLEDELVRHPIGESPGAIRSVVFDAHLERIAPLRPLDRDRLAQLVDQVGLHPFVRVAPRLQAGVL